MLPALFAAPTGPIAIFAIYHRILEKIIDFMQSIKEINLILKNDQNIISIHAA